MIEPRMSMTKSLIAPCGMNCSLCLGFQREKNKCLGCRKISIYKPNYCIKCVIKSCQILEEKKMLFCSDKCEKYPCKRLKDLDKRYKTKYRMSMLQNLEDIKKLGIKKFLENQKNRWTCKKCGELLCVHRNFCLNCGNK